MIGIYLPVYLLLSECTLVEISLFYTLLFSVGILTTFILMLRFVRHINISMAIAFIFRGLFYLSLYFGWHWIIMGILFGLAVGLYWPFVDLTLITLPKHKNAGFRISILYGLSQIASIFGPMLGGFAIVSVSYQFLFIFISVMLIPAEVVALKMGKLNYNYEKPSLDFYREYCRTNPHSKVLFIFSPLYGIIYMQSWVYYPLILRLFSDTEFSMGIIQTVINFLVVLSFLAAGRLFDLKRGRIIIVTALALEMISMLIIAYSFNIEMFTVGGWISLFGFSLMAAPYWAIVKSAVEQKHYPALVLLTGCLISVSRILFLLLVIPLFVSFGFTEIYLIISILVFLGLIAMLLFTSELYLPRKLTENETESYG
ncbi:MAG: hypothetical protein ACTSPL_08200 [Candidatus Odinarchaeia archaeon]